MNETIPEKGSLVFRPNGGKRRPIMVIKVAIVAGTPYNWLGFPITSKTTVKRHHLVSIEHNKLRKQSYAKIMDPVNFKWDPETMELAKEKFETKYVEEVLNKFKEFLND